MSMMDKCSVKAEKLIELRLLRCVLNNGAHDSLFPTHLSVCSFRAVGLMLGLVVIGTIVTVLDVILYPFLLCFDKRWVIPHRCVEGFPLQNGFEPVVLLFNSSLSTVRQYA